jgi:hypothetical protein
VTIIPRTRILIEIFKCLIRTAYKVLRGNHVSCYMEGSFQDCGIADAGCQGSSTSLIGRILICS